MIRLDALVTGALVETCLEALGRRNSEDLVLLGALEDLDWDLRG